MAVTIEPARPCLRFGDPHGPAGFDITPTAFLRDCLDAARLRFRGDRTFCTRCWTVEHPTPRPGGGLGATATIVAHFSTEVVDSWRATLPGTALERKALVERELQLVVEHLSYQVPAGFLAITEEQRALFLLDFGQLVDEALARTSFHLIGRGSDSTWEGTLVTNLRPARLVVALTVGLATR
ncbi:MAG: hypothetical protein ACYDBQ_12335 [Thermoplasmatota archaeon]